MTTNESAEYQRWLWDQVAKGTMLTQYETKADLITHLEGAHQ
jgi:hypothetical protein